MIENYGEELFMTIVQPNIKIQQTQPNDNYNEFAFWSRPWMRAETRELWVSKAVLSNFLMPGLGPSQARVEV